MTTLYNMKRGVAGYGNLVDTWDTASFTIGAEAGDSINVAVQLEDENGDPVTQSYVVTAYISGDSGGLGLVGTAPNGDVAIGTDGEIFGELTADKVFLIESEADGDIDLDIGDTGSATFYLVLVHPTGRKIVSDAITFAA